MKRTGEARFDLDTDAFSELLGKLYDGASEPDPYRSFLRAMRDVLQLNFAILILRQPNHDDGGLLFVSGGNLPRILSGACENRYTHRYFAMDPFTQLPIGNVVTLDEVVPEAELTTSTFYEMCMQPADIHHIAGIDLCDANGRRFGVRFGRPRASRNFSAAEKGFLELLAPHIRRSVTTATAFAELDSERELYSNAVLNPSIGTVALDESGQVLRLSDTASEILRAGDGLCCLHNRIHLGDPHQQNTLSEKIRAALARQRQGLPVPVIALPVPRRSGRASYELIVKSIAIDPRIDAKGSAHLIVFLSDPEKETNVSMRTLMSLHRLTETEARLAILLAEGLSVDEVGERLGIARNTVRAHLRAIFAKTGVTRQPMLVSLVLKSLASLN